MDDIPRTPAQTPELARKVQAGRLSALMAEPALRQKRAEPFGQRASAHVHVHAHTLASQGGLRSLLRTTGNMGLVGARRQRGV